MAKLNFAEASVPGIDVKAPISVKQIGGLLPAFIDYTPSEKKTKEKTTPSTVNRPSGEIHSSGLDYAPAAIAEKIRKSHQSRIKELAQQIYADQKAYREEYNKARATVEHATQTEKGEAKYQEAKRVLETKKPPMTPEAAIEKAKAYLMQEIKTSEEKNED